MVAGVPAWKPHATLAEVTTSSSPASSVTSSPRSALRSTDGRGSAGIRHVEGAILLRDLVAQAVIQRAGAGVVGEHVEPQDRMPLGAGPERGGVHDRGAVALPALVLADHDVVDE